MGKSKVLFTINKDLEIITEDLGKTFLVYDKSTGEVIKKEVTGDYLIDFIEKDISLHELFKDSHDNYKDLLLKDILVYSHFNLLDLGTLIKVTNENEENNSTDTEEVKLYKHAVDLMRGEIIQNIRSHREVGTNYEPFN